ncbi:hypothetical protein BDZ91DRAFT_779235 [Kalaharituber pfeilii]|nr:hypothetical protein BDZ91DRAFT_779235 [Kalaharituber pfeilii]
MFHLPMTMSLISMIGDWLRNPLVATDIPLEPPTTGSVVQRPEVTVPETEYVHICKGPQETLYYSEEDLKAILQIFPSVQGFPKDEEFSSICNYLELELPDNLLLNETTKWMITMKLRASIENHLLQLGFIDLESVQDENDDSNYKVLALYDNEPIQLPEWLLIPYVSVLHIDDVSDAEDMEDEGDLANEAEANE